MRVINNTRRAVSSMLPVKMDHTPFILYLALSIAVLVVYIIYTSKTAVAVKDIINHESNNNGKEHLRAFLHVFDVGVVYGIMILLIKLLVFGAVIYLLCINGNMSWAYAISVLIVIVWVTLLVVFVKGYNDMEPHLRNIIKNQ